MAEQKSVIQSLGRLGDTRLIRKELAGTTASNTILSDVEEKLEVIDVWFVKTNAAAGAQTLALQDEGGNAISDAMDVNDADQTISRITTIDDAYAGLTPDEGLLAVFNNTAGNAGVLYVLCARIAP